MSYRILLLSAYDAMSHQTWRNRLLEMFPEHDWTQLLLPPRHFNWRIRGNSLQWALSERAQLTQDYDLLIATSMVDLASLRGFVPELSKLPTMVYFHENQFVYPAGSDQRSSNIEPVLVPLYAAYCADAIVFNSDYNRSTFLQGAQDLLAKLPDKMPPALLQRLQGSEVIPVPLGQYAAKPRSHEPKTILDVVWNHRWEYDKGPKLLLLLAEQIVRQRLRIRLHVVGQQFRSSPPEFEQIDTLLQQHTSEQNIERGRFGFIGKRDDYTDLLRRCDVVLSTAAHDFQGLAIQEACALGCTPLVPDSLVYPEYIEDQFLYRSAMKDGHETSCEDLLAHLKAWLQLRSHNSELPKISLKEYSQQALHGKYAELFERLITSKNG
ncbi:MAG: DUF3524 domain-containing protein [Pseudohongiellaceae bacterium]